MREIVGFPMYTLYQDGRIHSKYSGKFLKPVTDSTGYPIVSLVNSQGKFKKSLHRLLAEHFIDNPGGKSQVNHKDGDKTNYSLDNLEWNTPKENSHHASLTGLINKRTAEQSFAVKAVNLSTGVEIIFTSFMEGSRQTGTPQPNITKVVKGLRKSAGGYTWSLL